MESGLTSEPIASRPGAVRRIAVTPASEVQRRASLFAALEALLPVTFKPTDAISEAAADAVVAFADARDCAFAGRVLVVPSTGRRGTGRRHVQLGSSPAIDRRLRGRSLLEANMPAFEPLVPNERDEVLATAGGRPYWTRRMTQRAVLDIAACAPPELGAKEVLRDRLKSERFVELLPLFHFLREISNEIAWRPPPLRAQIMFDDPNLHWPSYGHVSFPGLADHAAAAGYHVSFAMVPLDASFASRRAVRAFERARGALSLLIHGNNHVSEELLAPQSTAAIEMTAAEALRRVARFERRTGLHVDRVMCPPHGVCSETCMAVMLRLGYEAICANWPFPWPPGRPPADWLLAGCDGAQFLAGAFPVIPRSPIYEELDDLVFRALLDQPLIVYGHHGDVSRGPDALSDVVALVNSLGDVHWCSSERIARTNYLTRRRGARLEVRMLSRRIELDISEDVDEVVVNFPPVHGDGRAMRLTVGDVERPIELAARPVESEPVPVVPGRVAIAVGPAAPLEPASIARPSTPPRAIARRVASEARDRIMPIAGRLRPEQDDRRPDQPQPPVTDRASHILDRRLRRSAARAKGRSRRGGAFDRTLDRDA